MTGALLEPGRGINAKRIAILKEAVPNLRRVAYIAFRHFREDVHAEVRDAAAAQGVIAFAAWRDPPGGFTEAFSQAVSGKTDALIVGSDGVYYRREIQEELHALAIRHRLPVMHCLLAPGETGGLMAYATDLRENYRIAARMVDRILRGTPPGGIPMEQATRFMLVINRSAAKAIGLTIPRPILVQADRVIE